MRKFAFTAALLAATAATPAFAQDGMDAPRGGFHVSGIVGYDAPDTDVEDSSGVVYGIGAGYDFNIGNIVAGPEVELTTSSTDECQAGVNRTGDLLCVGAGRDIYVGARVGTYVTPNTLVYVGAGYTNAAFDVSYDANLTGSTGDFSAEEELDGFRLKGGVELGIGRNAFVRGEYRYSSYDEGDLDRHQLVGAIGLRF